MPLVKLYANLRNLADTKEVSIEGASVGEVVYELVKRNPALGGYLFENEQIRPHVIITINGHPTTDMDALMTEQDEIAVFPPIAGGAPSIPFFFPPQNGGK